MNKEYLLQDTISSEIFDLRNAHDYQGAISKCEEAIRIFPQNNFFHKILGDIYLQIDDYSNAAKEYLINLQLTKNVRLFKNFIRFFRALQKKASPQFIDEYKHTIQLAIQRNEFSKEVVEQLVFFLGDNMIIDQDLGSQIIMSDNDHNYDKVSRYIKACEQEKKENNIRALINHRIQNPNWQHSKKISLCLFQSAERISLFKEALALIKTAPVNVRNLQIDCSILRICRRIRDYSVAETLIRIDDRFIKQSDFNIQYELVYYFHGKGMTEELDKALHAMRASARHSIPIARTLYNFLLSFEKFKEAQEVYDLIQNLITLRRAESDKSRTEEQVETEQAVWQKMKDLVSEQEHNRQLAAMRDLLKGFSHELGQPITNIRFAVQLCQMKIARNIFSPESLDQLLNGILEQTTRIGVLLDRFRPIVSSKSKDEKFSIRQCIDDVFHDLQERLSSRKIHYRVYGNDTIYVYGDRVQFSQVFYNLVLNSMQAMVEAGNITVRIYTDDKHTNIVFTDDGPGIPIEIQQKVFEPFFTTKDPTSGNGGEGLGLFIVWNIIKMLNGTITIDKYYKDGARFVILLPKVEEENNDE